jgi:hypothetical protein
MPKYSEFVDRILRSSDLLKELLPRSPLHWDLPGEIAKADNAALLGTAVLKNAAAVKLVRGGLLYAVDALDAGHRFFQDDSSDLGAYWHGMMHRREADFDNARYWFRRAGRLSFFAELHRQAFSHSADMARQDNWDAYLLTGLCEQSKFGATELTRECVALIQAEFHAAFDYTWRQAVEL